MTHRHFCDFAGHEWVCEGNAVRLSAQNCEPTPCVCLQHGVSMDEGDHGACIVELLACPEHRDEQLRQMGEVDAFDLTPAEVEGERVVATNENGESSIGFCLWCGRDFYSLDEVWIHNGESADACQVFRQFREEESTRGHASSPEDES
jgi:hypothetical protein